MMNSKVAADSADFVAVVADFAEPWPRQLRRSAWIPRGSARGSPTSGAHSQLSVFESAIDNTIRKSCLTLP